MPSAALRALLEHAIDYAGLFPPADLALEPALENQASYVRSQDRWMLGAFILPIGKFAAAPSQLTLFSRENPLRVSALGPKTADAAEFREQLKKAADAIAGFRNDDGGVLVTQFEMPLPPGSVAESLGAVKDSLGQLRLSFFWEAPADAAERTIAALAGSAFGFKLRTGGVIADAFPTDAQIARALVASAKHRVPIKFTAGLHHPVKKFHESVATKMHGFLNVLGAGVLAAEHCWNEIQTAEMLADENAGSFNFDDATFRWRNWSITTSQITARRRLVTSLGSCSFDEPRDDLRALGLF
ncbi:MAG: hypothetical protein H0X40_00040 [Chthoniobacterales bacterium]|nr:hypothetical protein [Chthoniobacterales bacterium]